MTPSNNTNKYIKYIIIWVWVSNCILWWIIAIQQSWLPYINAWYNTYTSISADPFDWTTYPILYIPDWTKAQYQNKTTQFSEIPINDYIPLPRYDINLLSDTTNTSKSSTIMHYTYITPYMWSYRLNYKEHDGSHNAVDIRAPLGTPVLSIANGVVIRTVEADATGNRFVVIRHDKVPLNGKIENIYSWYLHLGEIQVREWTKVKKWDMIGRVGMSGITTTPHLHIQIDTENAPYHPYWPFTSADSKAAGLSFFDSINAGLWKEAAGKYSIHPMDFINAYAGWIHSVPTFNSAPPETTQEITAVNASLESIIASMSTSSNSNSKPSNTTSPTKTNVSDNSTPVTKCQNKRFSDMSTTTKQGKILYELVDKKCMFQNIEKYNPSATINQKDAITLLMQYYNINPTNGTSHFLDIDIGDPFQGYALTAYKRWILDGNYAQPNRLLSKADFVELLVKIGKFEKNPSQLKIYKDTTPMNLKFQYIQDYAFKIRAKWGNFYPESLLTRQSALDILGNVMSKDPIKKY